MRVIPDSITGVPQCNAPSTTPSGSRLRSFRSLSLHTSSARYRLLRLFPSTPSDRTIPRLTYAYNVATLTPNSSAARPALRYRSSTSPTPLRRPYPQPYYNLICESILIHTLMWVTIRVERSERKGEDGRELWDGLCCGAGRCGGGRDPVE